jgi:hypothetical protein
MTHRQPMPKPQPASPVPPPPPVPAPPVVPPPPPAEPAFLPAAPLPITRDTPFRATGDVPYDVWYAAFANVHSPLSDAVIQAMYDAAHGISALVLDRLRAESTYGAGTLPAHNNVLGLRVPGTLMFQEFASPVECVKELVRRWSDPTYKNGVYYPKDLSLAAMLAKYSPPDENSTESLIRAAVSNINSSRSGTSPQPAPPPPTSGITFGRVPVPKNFQDRQIPDAQNHAWDNLGQRVLRGIVYHRMLGTLWGTDAYFRQGAQGLTDWGLDHNTGEILRWNDYLGRGKPGISPNRAPWASGPWQNPPGDGRAFVAKFGVNGINRDLSAIEISGNYDTPLSEAGIEAIVALSAYLADVAKVPWDTFPTFPSTGLTFVYFHQEFCGPATKICPGPVVMNATPSIITRTAALLRKYQES